MYNDTYYIREFKNYVWLNTQATTDLARYTVFPVPDGEFLLKDPFLLAAEGSINPANVMVGCLSEEGNMAVEPMFGRDSVNKEAYGVYMANILQMRDPLVQDLATVVFGSDEMVRYSNSLLMIQGALLEHFE